MCWQVLFCVFVDVIYRFSSVGLFLFLFVKFGVIIGLVPLEYECLILQFSQLIIEDSVQFPLLLLGLLDQLLVVLKPLVGHVLGIATGVCNFFNVVKVFLTNLQFPRHFIIKYSLCNFGQFLNFGVIWSYNFIQVSYLLLYTFDFVVDFLNFGVLANFRLSYHREWPDIFV